MSQLIQVWDKNGEMFEVSPLNAHDLITHNGWTRVPPKNAEEAPPIVEPVVEKRPGRKPKAFDIPKEE